MSTTEILQSYDHLTRRVYKLIDREESSGVLKHSLTRSTQYLDSDERDRILLRLINDGLVFAIESPSRTRTATRYVSACWHT